MTSGRTFFRIPIGDWSGDGHGHCDYYTASSAKPISDVREAYFAGVQALEDGLDPEEIASDYEVTWTNKAIADKIYELSGIRIDSGDNYYTEDDRIHVVVDELAAYVVWVINRGDPTCDVRLEPSIDDMLSFYGADEKGRHIGFIGYGAMSW